MTTHTGSPAPGAPLSDAGAPAWAVPDSGEGLLLLLCDQSGVVRGLSGPAPLLARARQCGLAVGADLSASAAGQSAVALAMAGQGSAEVRGEAHHLAALRGWNARAEAVSAGGAALGYVAVWWPAGTTPEAAAVRRALHLGAAVLREHAARREAAWLLQLLEDAAAPARGYLIVDARGTVLLATPAAQRFLGVAAPGDLTLDLPFLWQQLQRGQRGRTADATFVLRPPAVPNACSVTARPLPGEPTLTAVTVEVLLSGSRQPEKAFTARFRFEDIITASPHMQRVVDLARSAAASDSPVLLLGESGTGKELVAQAIHNGSPRARGPFIAVNCAAFPRDLIVSELFGYEEGAYTGARRQGAPGRFEQADGGTLFLDEIGEMALEQQAMLLRVLEEHTVLRLGGGKPRPVDVRIIAATNQDLQQMVAQGRFRADLYYRLHVIAIRLPPLRERPEDVELFVRQFSEREGHARGRRLTWTPEALAEMRRYPWPGNVRELYNVVKRAAVLAAGEVVGVEALPWLDAALSAPHAAPGAPHAAPGAPPAALSAPHAAAPGAPDAAAPARRRLRPAEVAAALQAAGGNVAEAARSLGVARSSIYRLQKRQAQSPARVPAVPSGAAGAGSVAITPSTGARKGRER